MPGRRSIVLGLALVVLQAVAAVAQPAHPWTGIAANEARPATTTQYGNGGNDMSPRSMSADGRFVIFHSSLSHLVPGDTNGWNDVFLRDRSTGELRIVSVASDGSQGNHYSAFSSISSNGRHIAFNSCATNFDAADTNNSCDLFIHDRELGTTVRANLGPDGEQAVITTQHHFNMSADGRYFVFNASFSGYDRKIWLRDRDTDANGVFDEPGTGGTILISQPTVGPYALYGHEDVAISHDGRWIVYDGQAWDPVAGFSAGTRLFLHDRVAMTTVQVDRAMAGMADTPAYSSAADFSESGHLVYSSNADNLAEGDTDGNDDVYVYDIATGVNTPIELTHPGAPALDAEWAPALSADGRFVAFLGAQWGSWQSLTNVFAIDRQTGLSYEISVRPDGSRDNTTSAPSIAADGSAIAFSAGAEMLPNSWGNSGVFVATGVVLSPSEIEVPAEGGTFTLDVTVPAGIAWSLVSGSTPEIELSPTSGVGPATVEVTIWHNISGAERDFSVSLGTEQVRLHQHTEPVVYFVWPNEGPAQGGTDIEIFGFGFVPGTTVTVGGVPATNVAIGEGGVMTATTPPHALGMAMLTVTNPGGESDEFPFFYVDNTPPVVTPEVSGTLGQNGWYTSDVWVNWHYEDPESTVFLMMCQNPYQQTTDTASLIVLCSVMSEGGDTFAETGIKRDTLAPLIALSPSVPETYLQGQVVPIAHYCSDATSGIATCTLSQPGPNLDTSAVGTFELSLTAVDMAGHSTTTSTSYTVRMATTINVPVVDAVYGGGTASLSATLLGTGTPLAGKTISFFVDNIDVGTAITSASGEALLNLPLDGRTAMHHPVRAEFAGDDTAFPSTAFGDLVINKATPTVTWANPAFIAHGTALSGAQLNATSSVAGAFAYDPDAGTVLAVGTHTLTVQFAPQDSGNYNAVSKTVTLKVKAVPVITWAAPAPVNYPAFSSPHLNATADVPGSFSYNPPSSTLLPAGTHTLTATFTPTNTSDYVTTSATITLEVRKGTPVVTWPHVDPITYKTPLGPAQFNATANASGTFTYSPVAGTILPAGTHTLSATFTPADSSNWEPATATKSLLVGQYPASVIWDFPAPITYGTPLGPAQQNASVYPADLTGTWSYYPAPGTVMEIGTHWITVVFNPDDPNYGNGSSYASLTVGLGQSTVSWSNPAPIVYPQSLQNAQLNATASLPGTFNYTPGFGTVMPAGTHTLHVAFTPTDSTHYYGASRNVSIVVAKRTPAITWNNPSGISYGAALSAAQLNATANVAGTFTYSPALGTVLPAGTHALSLTFTPTDSANNLAATATASITVAAATPVVAWSNPPGIVYGAALGAAQLNATANVPGSFDYAPVAGTVLTAGTQALSVTFTPTDAANYTTATGSVSIGVAKAATFVTWGNPASMTYGTALSATQLNATANVAGTFAYSPAAGTVLNAGTRSLSVTFTPADSNYTGATADVSIVVAKAAALVTWANPANVTYGTALSAPQLNATASVAGTFVYSPPAGTVLNAGTHQLAATFTPNDSANYDTTNAAVTVVVGTAAPVLAWANPAGVTYGTALSAAQLNASANVAGTFVYSPALGTVLNAGTQQLSVTFTPADSANYTGAAANVSIVVAKAATSVTWPNPAGVAYGTALSGTQLNATANVPGSFSYSPAAGTVLGAGSWSLSVIFTPADSGNYLSSTGAASIVIAPVALTVRTNNASKVYGQALPASTASGTGFVNGDSMPSLGGTLSFTTSATAMSAPGTYGVMPSGATSGNYSISFAAGTLTVTQAATSVAMTTTPSPSNHNQSVQLRAVISAVAPGAGTPTGTVQFRENGTLLGTATLVNGVATMNKSFKRGTHPLTATYSGSTNFTGSSGGVTHQTQ